MPDAIDRRFEPSLEARLSAAEAWIESGRESQHKFEDVVLTDLKDIKSHISELNIALAQSRTQDMTVRRFGEKAYSTFISVAVVIIGFVLQHFVTTK